MSGASTAIVAALLSAVAFVFLRRWRPAGGRGWMPFVIGAVMIVASLVAGLWLLPIRSAPSAEPRSVGLVPPERPRTSTSPGADRGMRGFTLSTAVTVGDCGDPVEVVMVANGSAEYWSDRTRAFPQVSRFRIALPGTSLRDIKVGLSDRAIDSQFPMHAVAHGSRSLRALPTRRLLDVDTTVVSAKVRDWREHVRGIVVTFRANWLRGRGLESCYLVLPAITGGLSVLAAQVARGRATRDAGRIRAANRLIIRSRRLGLAARYDRGLETTFGVTTVVVRDGDVLGEASLPGPDLSSEGHPTWVCRTAPPTVAPLRRERRRTPDVALARRGGVFSRSYLAQALGSDCSSVAVIVKSDAGSTRDLVVLVLGAFFSLGAAIIVESALDRRGNA